MSQIAYRLRLTKQQITRIIFRLYEHGFVRRLDEPQDQRIVRLRVQIQPLLYQIESILKWRLFKESGKISPEQYKNLGQGMGALLRILPKLN